MGSEPVLVGVTGRAQHGKNTVGNILVERGFIQVAFADELKEMMLELDPIVYASIYPMHAGEVERLSDRIEAGGWEGAKRMPEVRRLLQVFGTEVMRNRYGDMVWVDALDRKVYDGDEDDKMFVITDVRFPNEAEWVHRNGGVILKVVRPGFDNGVDATHASEANVDTLPYDAAVVNDGPLEALPTEVNHALRVAFQNKATVDQFGGRYA